MDDQSAHEAIRLLWQTLTALESIERHTRRIAGQYTDSEADRDEVLHPFTDPDGVVAKHRTKLEQFLKGAA